MEGMAYHEDPDMNALIAVNRAVGYGFKGSGKGIGYDQAMALLLKEKHDRAQAKRRAERAAKGDAPDSPRAGAPAAAAAKKAVANDDDVVMKDEDSDDELYGGDGDSDSDEGMGAYFKNKGAFPKAAGRR